MVKQISNSRKLLNDDDLVNSKRKKHLEDAENLTNQVIEQILL